MTFGVKTNERPGTRAELKFARFSAYKAREVLNLIRGKSVAEARAILELTERGAAEPILKVLNSAVANAEHNDGIAADELYVSACFADEGPTLKRFRPRARGRAGRINKRTCHVTIIVSRFDSEQLELVRQKEARRGAAPGAAASRSRRVAGSRRSGQAAKAETATPVEEAPIDAEETIDEVLVDEAVASEPAVDEVEADEVADEAVEVDAEEADDAPEEGDK